MSSSLPVTFSRPPPLFSARPAEAMADADSAPAVALLADTLCEAAARGASDIHVEPGEHEWRIRLRIDGALHTYHKPPPCARSAAFHRMWCSLSP
jgi:type IV pilus assembly protein PilB